MSQPAKVEGAKNHPGASSDKRRLFARIALFYRQVIAELRKTVRPTKNELWTFFAVVLVFVIAIMAFVGLLDLVFGKLVMLMYGG